MLANHKKFSDFRNPKDRNQPLFDKEELDKTFIIDDQYMAIYDKNSLIISKKFLKCAMSSTGATPDHKKNWSNF